MEDDALKKKSIMEDDALKKKSIMEEDALKKKSIMEDDALKKKSIMEDDDLEKPKELDNMGNSCYLNVGFQSLAALESLALRYKDNDYKKSLWKDELYKVLYDRELRTPKTFIDAWNKQVLAERKKSAARTSQNRDDTSTSESRPRKLDPYFRGKPLWFLEDIFPLIWTPDEYSMLIQPQELEERVNVTYDYLKELRKDVMIQNQEKFEPSTVLMIESTYTDTLDEEKRKMYRTNAQTKLQSEFNKKLVVDAELNQAGKQLVYQLVSVIDFLPEGDGHYIAYVRRTASDGSENWYKTDDDKVSSVTFEDVLAFVSQPEILVFEMMESDP